MNYAIPYKWIRPVLNFTILYAAYMLYSMTSDIPRSKLPSTINDAAMVIFNTTHEAIRATRWRCTTDQLRSGLPRLLISPPSLNTSGNRKVTTMHFPWAPINNDDRENMKTLQKCLIGWFNAHKSRVVCLSSYTVGASTNAIVIRIQGKATVMWEPNITNYTSEKWSDLRMGDMADHSLRHRVRAPRKIHVTYTKVDDHTLMQGKPAQRMTVLHDFDAHCIWAYVGPVPL